MSVPDNLRHVAEQVRETGEPHIDTVRTLLSWFGQQRRGRWVVSTVRSALREVGLTTEPDFESAYIDGSLIFRLEKGAEEAGGEPKDQEIPAEAIGDPVARIRQLPAANRVPTTVTRDSRVAEAVTRMLMNDYSQLPVMPNERTVHGLISWRSIGRVRARNQPCEFVRQCMEQAVEVRDEEPLLDAVALIAEREVVLVRSSVDKRITGLVTTSDISLQFHELAEPFLLLAEIENHVRRLIDDKFSVEEVAAARNPADDDREVSGVADLTFGEYGRLLEVPENWDRLNLDLDRAEFIVQIKRVGSVRNDVMHFSPDGVSPDDLELLRDTVRFLQQV